MAGNVSGVLEKGELAKVVLRQDLSIYPAEPNKDGSPAWILHDPLSNRHFHLGETEIDLLGLMGRPDGSELKDIEPGEREAVSEQLKDLYEFLQKNNLTVADVEQRKWFKRQHLLQNSSGWLTKLAKSYLFIRIPLWSPDRFLDRTIQYVRWVGKPVVPKVLLGMLVVGVLMVLRESNSFVATFLHFFTLQGMAAYILTLFVIKVVHELGHAYVAKSMGCRVPIIGVAFLVGWPVLYTDTSDAWKLASREKRMKIGIAGVSVELAVAIVALFLWGLAPEGIVKSVLFILATTTWVLSVLVNFNPLMKFDGYYLLSDWLRIPNMEPRSMAMAKWWLRETLFALGQEPPEPVQRKLIVYAISVWIYRFFLFLGIAVLVYYFFFKLLGIILFLVEIIYFLARPIYREIAVWWQFRSKLTWNRNTITSASLASVLFLSGFIPWNNRIVAPAQLEIGYTQFYFPATGKINEIAVENGDTIKKGDLLVEVSAPDLEHDIAQLRRRYAELHWNRQSLGFDREMRSQALVIVSELATQNQRLRGKIIDQQRLRVESPHDGVVVNRANYMVAGDWVSEGKAILALLDPSSLYATAYVSEENIGLLNSGNTGVFYPEKGNWDSFGVEVKKVDSVGIRSLDTLYMASTYGGKLAVRANEKNELIPVSGTYKVRLEIDKLTYVPSRVIRGEVKLFGESESFYSRVKRQAITLYRKESGF